MSIVKYLMNFDDLLNVDFDIMLITDVIKSESSIHSSTCIHIYDYYNYYALKIQIYALYVQKNRRLKNERGSVFRF